MIKLDGIRIGLYGFQYPVLAYSSSLAGYRDTGVTGIQGYRDTRIQFQPCRIQGYRGNRDTGIERDES